MGGTVPPKATIIDDGPLSQAKSPEVWTPPKRAEVDAGLTIQSIVGDVSKAGLETEGIFGPARIKAVSMLATACPHHVVFPRDLSGLSAARIKQIRVGWRWILDELLENGTVTCVTDFEIVDFMGVPERIDNKVTIKPQGVVLPTITAVDLCTRYKIFLRAEPFKQGE